MSNPDTRVPSISSREKLKYFIKKEGLTVSAVEKLLGKSNGYLNSTDNISFDVIKKLAQILPNLNLNWWLGTSEEMYYNNVDTAYSTLSIIGQGVSSAMEELRKVSDKIGALQEDPGREFLKELLGHKDPDPANQRKARPSAKKK